jgi:hypothetical protein
MLPKSLRRLTAFVTCNGIRQSSRKYSVVPSTVRLCNLAREQMRGRPDIISLLAQSLKACTAHTYS